MSVFKGSKEFFPGIGEIKYEGASSKNPLAFKYYDAEKEYEKEEMKSFLSSVWEFVAKIFGGGEMSEETDWPVERTLQNLKWIWT